MVSPRYLINMVLVLFSRKDGCWKITDFGFTTKGTSTHAEPCPDGNGSVGYRAPEIIPGKALLTNKVDIWALGCILFEVAKGNKAFGSDGAVREYAVSRTPLKSFLPINENEKELCGFLERMLNVDASQRPTAEALRREFTAILWRSIGEELQKQANQVPPSSHMRRASKPIVHVGHYATWYRTQGKPLSSHKYMPKTIC
jgi:serine/threonine protein kinase